jgi:hypothetical protein
VNPTVFASTFTLLATLIDAGCVICHRLETADAA